MAVETQPQPQPTHEHEPITRDRLFIGGEWVEPHSSGTFEVVDSTTEQVIEAVRRMNDDPSVDAMLVQHPTPPQVDYEAALAAVDPDKDVDGMHPLNMGRLALGMPAPIRTQ